MEDFSMFSKFVDGPRREKYDAWIRKKICNYQQHGLVLFDLDFSFRELV
jgi:hypothetical protein